MSGYNIAKIINGYCVSTSSPYISDNAIVYVKDLTELPGAFELIDQWREERHKSAANEKLAAGVVCGTNPYAMAQN